MADAASERVIRVSAVVMRNREGRVLNVRKAGTSMLMLPGGKPESGESPLETAMREFSEELGIELDPARMRDLGVFRADAANESGFTVEAAVFEHPFVAAASRITPLAEIEYLEWVPLDTQRADVAPLGRDAVFPALRSGAPTHPRSSQPYDGIAGTARSQG